MNQKYFTYYVVDKLLEKFPQLQGHCNEKPNDTVDIVYPSKKRKVELLIATSNNEITIGFLAENGCFNWHIHMDMLGAKTSVEMVNAAIQLIGDTINDKLQITWSNLNGFFIDYGNESLVENDQDGEVIKFAYWNDL